MTTLLILYFIDVKPVSCKINHFNHRSLVPKIFAPLALYLHVVVGSEGGSAGA